MKEWKAIARIKPEEINLEAHLEAMVEKFAAVAGVRVSSIKQKNDSKNGSNF